MLDASKKFARFFCVDDSFLFMGLRQGPFGIMCSYPSKGPSV